MPVSTGPSNQEEEAGDAALSHVRKPASDASSPEALVKGLNAVATFIEETLKNGNADDVAALAAFQVGEGSAAELRATAAAIQEASKVTAATGKRVSKRALDMQDGRVLALIDVVHRAFRLARRSDKSILMPELNRLSPLFVPRYGTNRDHEADQRSPFGVFGLSILHEAARSRLTRRFCA
jgi:hypothetical protein